MTEKLIHLPQHGLSRSTILAQMDAARAHDVHWRQGQVFSLVFDAGDEVNELAKTAYTTFFSENGLNPTAFPSLRRFETEVVAMVGALLGGDGHTAGNMTTGGSESILMARRSSCICRLFAARSCAHSSKRGTAFRLRATFRSPRRSVTPTTRLPSSIHRHTLIWRPTSGDAMQTRRSLFRRS